MILMFNECERQRCMNVTITQDLVDEPDEFFSFHLNRTPGLSPRIELDPVDGRIEIVDDDSEQCIIVTIPFILIFSLTKSSHNSGVQPCVLHNN